MLSMLSIAFLKSSLIRLFFPTENFCGTHATFAENMSIYITRCYEEVNEVSNKESNIFFVNLGMKTMLLKRD